jgi:8-oxo-dGTP pyrophosphatase MutT (NUDIX family)
MQSYSDDLRKIRQSLTSGLPGFKAQQHLAPVSRSSGTIEYLQRNPDYKTASVVLLIYPVNDRSVLVLMERADFGNHGGQIALPGGKKEQDETYLNAALRETFEEIGVLITEQDVITPLTQIYIPPSNFLVHPFVASLPAQPEFIINKTEVKRIIEIPLHSFNEKVIIRNGTFINSSGIKTTAPYYAVSGIEIWGATAMIISEFSNMFK